MRVEEPSAWHLPYLWAAYRRGCFAGMRPDLKQETFGQALDEAFLGRRAWVLIAVTPRGFIPVALVTAIAGTPSLWPHVIWFPEASTRNKLEAMARFCATVGAMQTMVTIAGQMDAKLFRRIARYYPKLSEVGTIRGYFGADDGVVFQTHVL